MTITSFQQQINQKIEVFIGEITSLARKQALLTLEEVLAAPKSTFEKRFRPVAVVAAREIKTPTTRKRSGKRVRRSADDLAETQSAVMALLESRPGLTTEEITAAIGMPRFELQLPIRKLVSDGGLRTEGEKRAMRYFPAKSGKKRN